MDFEEYLDEAGMLLIKELKNNQVINESDYFGIRMEGDKYENLLLSEAVKYKGTEVPDDRFRAEYTNYDKNKTPTDVLRALNLPAPTDRDSARKALSRMVADYNTENTARQVVNIANREARYGSISSKQIPPTPDDIDGGTRGRRSKTSVMLDRLNSQELLKGDFYSDITRIPKSRWSGWLKFWDRQKSSVEPNRQKKWGKYFLMGYEVGRSFRVEIWYNSLDSTFSVYDKNGVELGRPSATLQETVKYLVTQIAQFSSEDSSVFSNGGVNNSVAQSMIRSLTGTLDDKTGEKERQARLARLDRSQQRRDRADTRSDNVKDAARDRRGDEIKATVKSTVGKMFAIADNLTDAQMERMTQAVEDSNTKAALIAKRAIREATRQSDVSVRNIIRNARKFAREFGESSSEIITVISDIMNDTDNYNQLVQKYETRTTKNSEGGLEKTGNDDPDWSNSYRDTNSDNADRLAKDREKFNKTRDHFNRLQKDRERFNNVKADFEKASDEDRLAKDKELFDKMKRELEGRQKNRSSKTNSDINRLRDEINKSADNKNSDAENEKFFGDLRKELSGRNNQSRSVSEAEGMDYSDIPDINNQRVDGDVQSLRTMAQNSPYTQAALKSQIMTSLISDYTETRVQKKMGSSRLAKWFKNGIFGRGRTAKLELPTDMPAYWDRLRMAFFGQKYRADFIIGFTINDKVNIEVWYVVEPDPDFPTRHISSFYVYDINSMKIIRKNLPYYRNAIQVAMAKLGVTV